MCSALCLIALYICVKFRENISNDFQLTEQTRVHGRNDYVQCSKGNNSKSRQSRVTVDVFSTSSQCLTTFGENISEALTDGRTDGNSKISDGIT